jgi:transcriptional regulator with XRE-family HTH domain
MAKALRSEQPPRAGEAKRRDEAQDRQLETLARELRHQRRQRDLSLEQLAAQSGVSRSMISKIERGEAVPSTSVLSKLAEALGITFSKLMASEQDREILVLKRAVQPVLRDAASGFTRRCLSPILPGRGIDWVLNSLPPGGQSGEFVAHRQGVEEYIYVLKGRLKAVIGDVVTVLDEGDALYFQADADHAFHNLGSGDCEYFLVIDSARRR